MEVTCGLTQTHVRRVLAKSKFRPFRIIGLLDYSEHLQESYRTFKRCRETLKILVSLESSVVPPSLTTTLSLQFRWGLFRARYSSSLLFFFTLRIYFHFGRLVGSLVVFSVIALSETRCPSSVVAKFHFSWSSSPTS